jgi:hypothetical protein
MHAVAQFVEARAISRKVAVSVPDGVVEIFLWHNPFGCTMVLESTQPLAETSTRNISWGKGDRGVGLTTLLHVHVPTVLKSVSLALLETAGPLQAYIGIALPF